MEADELDYLLPQECQSTYFDTWDRHNSIAFSTATKGLHNAPGENNCFVNSAVQVCSCCVHFDFICYLSIWLPVCLSVCSSVNQSIWLTVCVNVMTFRTSYCWLLAKSLCVCLTACLFVCLSCYVSHHNSLMSGAEDVYTGPEGASETTVLQT